MNAVLDVDEGTLKVTAERELLEALSSGLAAMQPIEVRHPTAKRLQTVTFDRPTLEEPEEGKRRLAVIVRDQGAPELRYGYKMELPPGWQEEMPPRLLAGLISTELVEIIEAADMGLPVDAVPGEVRWLED